MKSHSSGKAFMSPRVASMIVLSCLACFSFAQATNLREWSDSTGTFKVVAQLIEVKDGAAFLRTTEGKTLKIPLARLSEADHAFLKGGSNPFEEVDSGPSGMTAAATAAPSGTAAVTGASPGVWSENLEIDWSAVDDMDRSVDGEWNLSLPAQGELGFAAKRATLAKKTAFHEDIRRLEVNPIAQRAVVGYTVSFGVPKPQSRLSLIDLTTGKAVHTAPVEADMCPLALLNDGSTALMYGTSDERKGFETHDQIQLWKISGKSVIRSPIWVPFPGESEHFGKKINSHIVQAIPLPNNKLILLAGNGHLACIDVVTRRPFWHAQLRNGAIDASTDRSLLAVMDGQAVLIVDPQTGQVKAAQSLDDKPHVGWPKVRWSPSGNRLLLSFTTQLRVLDLTSGTWLHQCNFTGGPIAPNALSYPHDDYALLEGRLLVHIPSQIKVCEYRDAGRITVEGGTSFIGMQNNETGMVVPAKIPHPAAEAILAQAEKDPSVFLIHPGVEVSIDSSGAGQHASQVTEFLRTAATTAGYQVVADSPIKIAAAITGPKQEAISYIASGAYIANVYQSTIRLTWQGKDVWSTGGNNIPGFLQTARGQSIQDKLNELGQSPNLHVFEKAQFPKLLQRPSGDSQAPNRSEALLTSKFTMQGLIDSK